MRDWTISTPLSSLIDLACVAGATKGKGDARGGGGTEAPAAKPLFISSFSFAGERKIAVGSFLIMRQSLLDMTF